MCLVILVTGVLGPRIALVLTWVLTDRVRVAFSDRWLLPLLGLIVLPWTTLAYTFAFAPGLGVSFLGWWIVIAGAVADLLTYTGRAIQKGYDTRSSTASRR